MRADAVLTPLARMLGGRGSPPAGGVLLWSAGASLFFFPFSVIFLAGGLLRAGFGWTATGTILLYAVVIFASELRFRARRTTIASALLIAVLFFAVEWVGVNTGFPFGAYRYTGVLTPLLAGVPVAIAGAWYCTLITTKEIGGWLAGGGAGGRLRTALAAGALTLALDMVLEPFATDVNGYWLWEGGRVPLQNYLAWFVLSSGAVLLMALVSPVSPAPAAVRLPAALLVYGLQFFLFALIALLRGHTVEIVMALIAIGITLAATGGPSRLLRYWKATGS